MNQSLAPVTVTFFGVGVPTMVTVAPAITIPPGQLYFLDTSTFPSGFGVLEMASSGPMRMLEYEADTPYTSPDSVTQTSVFPPGILTNVPQLIQTTAFGTAASWTWQIGAAAPAPATWQIMGSFPFTVTVSSAPWLSVSPTQGTAPASLTVTPNISGLSAGSYSGTVTVSTILPPALSAFAVPDIVIPVSMQVNASPFITATGNNSFTATVGSTTVSTEAISVTSGGSPVQFSASVNTSSGGNWLSAVTTTGTTPGSIMVAANPSGLAAGVYSGNVVIQGPANTVTIALELAVVPASTGPAPLSATPSSLSFVLDAGTTSIAQPVSVRFTEPFTTAVQTHSGGNWLATSFGGNLPLGILSVNASAVGLSPGNYLGTITLTSSANITVQVSVTLTVVAAASPITVSPSSIALTLQAGQIGTQSFSVSSPASTLFNETRFEPGGQQWINSILATTPYTPATVTITFIPTLPGTYHGSVTVTSGSAPVTIPITLTVTASPASPPILGSIVSAASGAPSAISPGQIITLDGIGIGSTPSGLLLTPGGTVATSLGGTQVLIDNIAAPLVYQSASQVNAIVPYEVPSSGVATVQVTTNGLQSPTWSVPLAPAAPSIFTVGSTGVGQAAVLNQDSSVNSAANPAVLGTTVQIFATGGGQTAPASVTGSVTAAGNTSLLPVTVTIGGQPATVTYHGSAPDEVSGVLQVDAVVPTGVASGANVLTLTINGQSSQAGVTIAIK